MEVSTVRATGIAAFRGRAPLMLRLQSDERLVELIRSGNEDAFGTLVTRYHTRLLSFCRHMLRSTEDAEDVLQEVFAAAYNALLADEREINLRPWLYRIARNRSLNHLRRVQPQPCDTLDDQISENGATTADKVYKREEFRLLIADVQTLPETQRTALLLREIEALSYEQIAEAMETTVGAVKSLLVRARVSLAEAAQTRALSCEEVRIELGAVSEGLKRISSPVRKHIAACDRCHDFRKHLRSTNKALAAFAPIGPLLLFKQFILAKIGLGGSAAASATSASAASTGAAAGASGASSLGLGAIATKAGAGLAAAAIATAGAVEVKRNVIPAHHTKPIAAHIAGTTQKLSSKPPVLVSSTKQPASIGKPLPQQSERIVSQAGSAVLLASPIAAKPLGEVPLTMPIEAVPPSAVIEQLLAETNTGSETGIAPLATLPGQTNGLTHTDSLAGSVTVDGEQAIVSTPEPKLSTPQTPSTHPGSSTTEELGGPSEPTASTPNESRQQPTTSGDPIDHTDNTQSPPSEIAGVGAAPPNVAGTTPTPPTSVPADAANSVPPAVAASTPQPETIQAVPVSSSELAHPVRQCSPEGPAAQAAPAKQRTAASAEVEACAHGKAPVS